jgi:heme oxygenase (biliverdin-IX-beta and delta-forming)
MAGRADGRQFPVPDRSDGVTGDGGGGIGRAGARVPIAARTARHDCRILRRRGTRGDPAGSVRPANGDAVLGTTEDVMGALRRETGAYHARLERALDLLDPGLTSARYRAVLERFWGFCTPTEPAAAAAGGWGALGLDPMPRARAPALRADLLRAGHARASIDALPTCRRLPRLDTPARAVGYIYVFEGATLGGAVITRHLCRSLGPDTARAARFFGGRGRRVGPMWRVFTCALGLYAEATGETDAIVGGACDTFAALEAWLAGGHP